MIKQRSTIDSHSLCHSAADKFSSKRDGQMPADLTRGAEYARCWDAFTR